MKIEEKNVSQAMPGRRNNRRIERTTERRPADSTEQALRSMPGRRTARRVERRTEEAASSGRRETSVRRRDNRPKEILAPVEEKKVLVEENIVPEIKEAEAILPTAVEVKEAEVKTAEEIAPVLEATEETGKAAVEEPAETGKPETLAAPKKKSGLGGKAIAILVIIAVVVAAIVFGIIFLSGKENKSEKNFMDQLRTQEIVACEIEPVNQFFNDYYTSLSAGNTTDLENMFDEPEKANVSAGVSTIVEQYSDLQVYVTGGIEANEYAVFVSNNVKFNNIKTTAPSIDCFYITYMEEDGSVKIDADMYTDPEIIRFLTLASYMEPMRSMLTDTDKALTKALNSDKELKNLYIVMQSMTDAVLSNEATEE